VKAIVITKPGGPEVLQWSEVAAPEAQRGEVRVRVRATAVNRADLLQRMGAYPAPPDAPADIPGLELAGEIDAVGEGVRDWKVGDRVFGLVGGGAYAEQLVAPARALARMPERLSFREAAAVPEAFITAYDAMVTQGRLAAGETVLVHAVGSGVGTAAVQIVRALGARALGTARTAAKLDRARALGMADGVCVEGAKFAEAITKQNGGRGVDLVLELVGGPYVAEDLQCLEPRGRLVLVGLMAGVRAELDLAAILRKRIELRGTVLRSRPLEEKIAATQLLAHNLVPLLKSGAIAPVIDRSFSMSDAAAAHTYVASNEGFGKVVLEA
jgi:putative PIG3 family NAD(P)H quinone oxidoreductase